MTFKFQFFRPDTFPGGTLFAFTDPGMPGPLPAFADPGRLSGAGGICPYAVVKVHRNPGIKKRPVFRFVVKMDMLTAGSVHFYSSNQIDRS